MCLIIDNPDGLRIDQTLIDNAVKGNSDGWGFMTSRRGRIHITRGMTYAGLQDAIDAHEGKPHVVHFRFATHGTKNLDNCHPFSVLGGKYALMHNGILSVPSHDANRSDTWHFAEYVLGPILQVHPDLFGSQYLTVMLESIIGPGNKLVILRADGKTMIVNRKAGLSHDGLWLSNDYSLPGKTRALSAWPGWKWDDETEEVTDDEKDETGHGTWEQSARDETPNSLTDFADVEYGDLLDYVCDHPESVTELIRDFFDYELK